MQLKLFVTAGCHLCDLALLEINAVKSTRAFSVQQIEIGDDELLVSDYGVRIPVLQFPDGKELNWPFDHADITRNLEVQFLEL